VPSDGGAFEVTVNGKLLFSKLALHRFPEENEVVQLIGAAKV
jgi:selenoprotein W-related protein